jgi:hypothetical protein
VQSTFISAISYRLRAYIYIVYGLLMNAFRVIYLIIIAVTQWKSHKIEPTKVTKI